MTGSLPEWPGNLFFLGNEAMWFGVGWCPISQAEQIITAIIILSFHQKAEKVLPVFWNHEHNCSAT